MSCNEWKLVYLGELIDSVSKRHAFNKDKIIFLNTSDVLEGKILHNNYSDVVDLPGQAKKSIQKDDILFSEIRPKNKRFAYVNFNAEDYVVSTKLMVLRKKSLEIDNMFLYYFLTWDKTLEYLQMIAETRSGTFPQITYNELKNIRVNLPSLDEQKKISNIISSLDKKIELNNEMNKTLEEMAQALFKRWFVDFEFPNEEGKPYKSSGGEMVESELGMIPKGWCSKQLKDYIKFVKGKKPKVISEDKLENSKVYLTIDVLKRNSIQYAINDKVILADKKDVLMVMDGASAGSLFYGISGIVGSTLSSIVIINEILNCDILYYFLKYNEENIKGHLTGSAIPHTDKEYVNRLKICLPNDKRIITMITDIYSNIRSKVINNNEENMRLKELRDSLLPKLMSGEIKVKDIQANL